FALILAGFATAVYSVVTWQVAASLDRSLTATVDAAARLVVEGRGDAGALIGMLTPGRRVRVMWEGESGGPAAPGDAWVGEALVRTLAEGEVRLRYESPDDRTWHLYARAAEGARGRRLAVAAWAPAVELEEAYPGLLAGIVLAGLASLGLVAVGGWRLARRSLGPVDDAFAEMRRFMADAAHELRTPLAVVRGHADVALQRDRTPAEYRDVLSDVVRETTRMGDIVERLLLLARADAGDWPLADEALFLDDVVLDVAHAGGALGAPRGVRVEVGDVAEAPVRGDPGLLRQSLMALVDNAVNHGPDGGVVRLSVEAAGAACSAHVDDDGPGIPPELRSRVFERFYRGDPARGRPGGAGLGLPIAAWVARLHGGTLTLSAGEGGGTRATLTLPRSDP
ncbi:MAG TPA: HAMP domain-containing sensor histidine kinase, partial [Longimicrobiales bacterium]|nr:HAMP domain-containing sensor histidine kinase [Longimicrobiales bacterium]